MQRERRQEEQRPMITADDRQEGRIDGGLRHSHHHHHHHHHGSSHHHHRNGNQHRYNQQGLTVDEQQQRQGTHSMLVLQQATISPIDMKPSVHRGESSSSSDRERRKAFQATARYYSECSIRGIAPVDAEKAANNVNEQYGKWWPNSLKRKRGIANHAKEWSLVSDHGSSTLQHSSSNGVTATKVLAAAATTTVTATPSSCTSNKKQRRRAPDVVAACPSASVPFTTTDDESVKPMMAGGLMLGQKSLEKVRSAKAALIEELQRNGGDTTTAKFHDILQVLQDFYRARGYDARWSHSNAYCSMDGVWLTLSRPTYPDCLGRNEDGDYMYTLGRLAFDMFRPTGLRCSLQGIFQQIGLDNESCATSLLDDRPRAIPSRLLRERQARLGAPPVRTNDILVSFTIEPNQNRKGQQKPSAPSSSPPNGQAPAATVSDEDYVVRRPLRGLLTNHGYCLPDPEVPNRMTIWFCGGRVEPDMEGMEGSLAEWQQLFDEDKAPGHNFQELARILAARCFLGANLPDQLNPDGSMSYSLRRPIGGHGQVYMDVLYCDETMRIIVGHRGSIFVSIRPLESDMEMDDADDNNNE